MVTLKFNMERGFAAVTLLFTIWVMLGIVLFRNDIFGESGSLSVPEAVILIGLAVILVFNLYSLARLPAKPAISTEETIKQTGHQEMTPFELASGNGIYWLVTCWSFLLI